jgi:cardiolipin synthase
VTIDGGAGKDRVNPRSLKPWKALNWPNRISLLRLLMVGPFVVLLMNQDAWAWARYVALGIFVVMGFSDMLDGMLARRLNARTRLGAILDPMADKALIICAVVLLSTRGSGPNHLVLPNWVVVAVVGKDLWVIAGTIVVYLVTDRLRVQPTRAGKVCTFGQMIMVGYTLLAPDFDRLLDGLGQSGVLVTGWAVAVLSVLAIISYTRLGLRFTLAEGKPLEDDATRPSDRDGQH